MSELLAGIFGGGALVSLIVALLQYFQKQKGTNIDWYDRAISQVQMQDETITKLKAYITKLETDNRSLLEENDGLKDVIHDLEEMVTELENEKQRMIDHIRKYKRSGNNGTSY